MGTILRVATGVALGIGIGLPLVLAEVGNDIGVYAVVAIMVYAIGLGVVTMTVREERKR